MKKSYSIILIGILILSGYSTIAISNNDFNREKININFSNIQITDYNDNILINMEGTNSILIKRITKIIPFLKKPILRLEHKIAHRLFREITLARCPQNHLKILAAPIV